MSGKCDKCGKIPPSIDYKDKKYSNYELLFSSKEMQEKVFLLGI